MRASARTAIGVVAELVDVHAALGGGVVAGDVVGDGCRGCLGRLLEGDGSADFGVAAEDCDCVGEGVGQLGGLGGGVESDVSERKGDVVGSGGMSGMGSEIWMGCRPRVNCRWCMCWMGGESMEVCGVG